MGGAQLTGTIDKVSPRARSRSSSTAAGRQAVIGYFVGQVMKATRGQADPKTVNQMLREKLGQ